MKASPAIVIGIDQARSSGYAIARVHPVRPEILECGVAKTPADRAVVVAHALQNTSEFGLYVCFEDHAYLPAKQGRNTATVLGMGAARGRWEERLALAGVPASHYAYRVAPAAWRLAVLGLSAFVSEERAKEHAVAYARSVLGAELEHDAAEGLCITLWAARNIPAMLEQTSRKADPQLEPRRDLPRAARTRRLPWKVST